MCDWLLVSLMVNVISACMASTYVGHVMKVRRVLGRTFCAHPCISFWYMLSQAGYWQALPSLIFSTVAIAAGVCALLLPETLNQPLPETLQDGEMFGRWVTTGWKNHTKTATRSWWLFTVILQNAQCLFQKRTQRNISMLQTTTDTN